MPDTKPEIGLIIFDCDGVLVDSEPLSMRVLVEELARQGISISVEEAYDRFLGRSLSAVLDIVSAEYDLALNDTALEAMRSALFDLFRKELQPLTGAPEVVAALAARTRVCVASSSVPERLRLSLSVTGLAGHFGGNVFSATEVENGKPAPDLFLHAASTLGVDPANCLVIEDSPAGVEAARAAGMRVFGFAGGAHVAAAGLKEKIAAAGPERILQSLADLLPLIVPENADERDGQRMLVAVDAGTASVRAGVVTLDGEMLARVSVPITVWREGAEFGEYASTEIWEAACKAVRGAVAAAHIAPEQVAGICFDATCSLVVLDAAGEPLPISHEPGAARDTIAWFDHRAMAEAEEITATGHPVLDYSGGVLSPEMEMPKLLWIKRHRPDVWGKIGKVFDLADFLTWKATGQVAPSQSTLVSKWAHLAHVEPAWDRDYFASIGLPEMPDTLGLPPKGQPVGQGVGTLSAGSASALGLTEACVAAAGMIDAHAGAVGLLGEFLSRPDAIHTHLGLIAGTSSCVMALSADERHLFGYWGPYLGTVAPGLWLNEGGQSATGALLDHLIRLHRAGGEPDAGLHGKIIGRIAELRAQQGDHFAADLHILPDFNGNRSPLADPRPMGVISGLGMDEGFDGLCALYWRACVSIALGLRQIIETLREKGYGGEVLHLTGGHTLNPLLMELYADVTGLSVSTQPEADALLLGAAMCAASAAGLAPDLAAAGAAMRRERVLHRPDPARAAHYEADYKIFLAMQRHRAELDALAGGATCS